MFWPDRSSARASSSSGSCGIPRVPLELEHATPHILLKRGATFWGRRSFKWVGAGDHVAMALQKMTIRTRLFRHARPEGERENVVVSRIGEAWRSMEEFQAWARRTHAGSCAL